MDGRNDRSSEDQIDAPPVVDPHISVWKFFGRAVPRSEIVYLSQVIIVYIVIIACILNLSINTERLDLWIALLSSSLGYLMPAPQLENVRVPPVQ